MQVCCKYCWLAGLVLVLFASSGCTSINSADRLTRGQLDLMNQVANAFENNASEDVLEKLRAKMEANTKQINKLELSEEEIAALAERYGEQFIEASARIEDAKLNSFLDESIDRDLPVGMPGLGQ